MGTHPPLSSIGHVWLNELQRPPAVPGRDAHERGVRARKGPRPVTSEPAAGMGSRHVYMRLHGLSTIGAEGCLPRRGTGVAGEAKPLQQFFAPRTPKYPLF